MINFTQEKIVKMMDDMVVLLKQEQVTLFLFFLQSRNCDSSILATTNSIGARV